MFHMKYRQRYRKCKVCGDIKKSNRDPAGVNDPQRLFYIEQAGIVQ